MKKITVLSISFIISFQLFSQQTHPVAHNQVQTDFLKKSKKQRTAGWILTGTGAAMMTIGLIKRPHDSEDVAVEFTAELFGLDVPETHSNGSASLFFGGTAVLATGITFLSVAKKNKRKSLLMSFINEPSQQLRYNTVMNTSVPSLRVQIQF